MDWKETLVLEYVVEGILCRFLSTTELMWYLSEVVQHPVESFHGWHSPHLKMMSLKQHTY